MNLAMPEGLAVRDEEMPRNRKWSYKRKVGIFEKDCLMDG
jgi:hypothetical protein